MKRTKGIVVAIDGPAGAGKSTTAERTAAALGYLFIDTGAMYRAVTLAVLRRLDGFEAEAVRRIAEEADIQLLQKEGRRIVMLNGEDVTEAVRTPEVTQAIAPIAADEVVRTIMVRRQRELGKEGGVVAEGRDIGTVVFPDAELKVFMVASLDERAKRRAAELEAKGIKVDFQRLMEEIRRRDESDASRAHGALRRAEDALELDTTQLTIDEQVARIVQWAKERGA